MKCRATAIMPMFVMVNCEINAAHDAGKKPTRLRLGLGTILIFSTLGSTWVAST